MTPYQPGQDVYQTGADTRFNSFSDPSALAMNQRNGAWGIDPNLLTPSYTAAYRPSYNGYQGNGPSGPMPGFWKSTNQVINPFAGGGTNYGGNYYQQNSPYFDAMGQGAGDHAANFAQKWVVPGVSSWLSYAFLSKPLGDMSARFAGGVANGVLRGSLSASQTATAGALIGGGARLAGAMFLPSLVAEGISHTVDKAFFDPYVAQRQMSNDMRRNFAGVTFNDNVGNNTNGRGYSRYAASLQAGGISQQAAHDFSFSQSEMANMTDLASRSGVLDTMGNGSQLAERMKEVAKQVKMVMAIGNTSDFKEAIETISKLQMSGVSHANISSVYAKLGTAASIAGTSVQKMMNTVGAQGEYMFASNGLTPYVGQLTAANAYASFSMANQSGLLSRAALARMGGVEGATQSNVAGLLGMAQTPYARMTAMNRYANGGEAGSVVGNIAKFGGAISKDAMNQIGLFNMRRGELASKSLEDEDFSGQWKRLEEMAANMPNKGLDSTGQLGAGTLYSLLTQSMGLTDQNAQTMLARKLEMQGPGYAEKRNKKVMASYNDNMRKILEQEGVGGWAQNLVRPLREAWHGIEGGGSSIAEGISSDYSRLSDWIGDTYDEAFHGKINSRLKTSTEDSLNLEGLDKYNNGFGGGAGKQNEGTLNKLASNKDVIAAVRKGNRSNTRRLLSSMIVTGGLDPKYNKSSNMEELIDILHGQGIKSGKVTEDTSLDNIVQTEGSADGIPELNSQTRIRAQELVNISNDIAEGKMSESTLATFNKDTHSNFDYNNLQAGDMNKIQAMAARTLAIYSNDNRDIANKFGDDYDHSAANLASAKGMYDVKKAAVKGLEESKTETGLSSVNFANSGLTEMKIDGNVNMTVATVNITQSGVSKQPPSLLEWYSARQDGKQ